MSSKPSNSWEKRWSVIRQIEKAAEKGGMLQKVEKISSFVN